MLNANLVRASLALAALALSAASSSSPDARAQFCEVSATCEQGRLPNECEENSSAAQEFDFYFQEANGCYSGPEIYLHRNAFEALSCATSDAQNCRNCAEVVASSDIIRWSCSAPDQRAEPVDSPRAEDAARCYGSRHQVRADEVTCRPAP